MAQPSVEDRAQNADFLTTMQHIGRIVDREPLDALLITIDDLAMCADRIDSEVRNYRIPARADLEAIAALNRRFETAVDDAKGYYSGASVAAALLTGALLREPNGDVEARNRASKDAVSEAIV